MVIASLRLFPLSLLGVLTIASAQENQVSLGVGYQDQDRFRYGQFSGNPESGGFTVGGFHLASPLVTGNASRWSLEGRDLGLDTGRFSARYRQWGRYSLQLDFSQLPQAEVGRAWSPFIGSGGGSQSLPEGWVGATSTAGFTALDSSLRSVVIDRKRKRLDGEFSWQIDSELSLTTHYRRETKRGTDTYGAIFGSSGGNPRGALLRRPVDFDTTEFGVALDRSGGGTQYGVSYTAIDFDNRENMIRWQNPFNNPQWVAGAGYNDGAIGQLVLEPDNKSHQLAGYLGKSLSDTTRLTLSVSRSLLEQDDNFLPYSSVVDAPVAVPVASLDGRVELLAATVNLTSRLGSQTTVRARYRLRVRDNETDQALFQRVAGDAALQAGLLSDGARVNRLYDQQTDEYSLAIDRRLGSRTRVTVGVETREKDLEMVDARETTEQQVYGKLNLAPLSWLDGWLKLSRSERRSRDYDTTRPLVAGHNPDYVATLVGDERFENDPLLRRYSLANRNRTEAIVSASAYAGPRVGVTLMGRTASNDYPESHTGVQRSDLRGLSLDLSYTPEADWTAGVYLSEDRFRNRQYGYARTGGGNSTPVLPLSARDADRNWRVSTADRVRDFGADLRWVPEGRPYSVSIDLNRSRARTDTAPYSDGQAWQDLPEVRTEITSVSIETRVNLQERQAIRVQYRYEDYSSEDFALDRVLTDSLSNVLLLGNRSPAYAGHGLIVVWELRF